MKKNKISKIVKIIVGVFLIILSTSISKATDETVISKENWSDWQQESYWEWHTRNTTDDKAYNGKHIVIKNNVIDFYGYWKNSYKDFLYKEYTNPGKKIFKFRIDETKANYHTLDGAGFIFNASKVDNKLSGYIILFREKDICMYRIDNIDIETFETASEKKVSDYGELIKSINKTNSTIHDLTVEATPTNIKVTEAEQEILNVDLDYSKHSGESFGLISSYLQHACSQLSKIEFSQIELTLEDYKISVINTDLKGNSIANGTFQLKDEKGTIIKEGKADEKGIFDITGIKPGTYTIQQKVAPSTYVLNDNIYKFKITNDGKILDVENDKEIDLIIKNDQLKIEINNKLINTDISIPGSKIGLYDKDGKQVATAVTNSEGKAEFIGINEGTYTYTQLEVPNGYILNEENYTCSIDAKGTVTFNDKDKGIIYNEKVKKEENNTTISNTTKTEKDNTISTNPIPNTGAKINIICIVFLIFIISTILAIKLKKYEW